MLTAGTSDASLPIEFDSDDAPSAKKLRGSATFVDPDPSAQDCFHCGAGGRGRGSGQHGRGAGAGAPGHYGPADQGTTYVPGTFQNKRKERGGGTQVSPVSIFSLSDALPLRGQASHTLPCLLYDSNGLTVPINMHLV